MIENKSTFILFSVFLLFLQPCVLAQTPDKLNRYDIIVSEIMAKPSPTVGLPDAEYVELHNRLPTRCFLRNWKLKLGNTLKILPDMEIDSLGFAVIVANKNLANMQPFCNNTISLSSLSITDGGQSVTLYNEFDEAIHHVYFKMNWHEESIKQDGGWSLEMIDTDKPNAGKENWRSSNDNTGGTPGRLNSVDAVIHDFLSPEMSAVTMLDSITLRVRFSESVSLDGDLRSLFKVSPNLVIDSVSEVSPDFSSVDVKFTSPPQSNILYSVSVYGSITDCAGNRVPCGDNLQFGKSSTPRRNSLLINELLANSFDGSDADYLEIYNNSDEIIDMKDVRIGYGGDTLPKKMVSAVSKGMQLLPKSYLLLSKSRELTLQQYFCKESKTVVQCDSLPNFAVAEGVVFITDKSLQVIDRFNYNESMHYPKLLKTNGVALERLSFERPTQDKNNWFSASETSGYGTPGYENSQMSRESIVEPFGVSEEVFSPDNDGFDDYLEIFCKFDDEGTRVTITVFNDKGFVVRCVANNEMCGKENVFLWDGTDERGNLLPPGFYILQLESWNLLNDKCERKRKAVAIYR